MSRTCLALFVALLLAVIMSACDFGPHEVVTVAGPRSYLGARVVVDGEFVGMLEPLQIHGGLYERLLKTLYPGSGDILDTVVLNVGVGPVLSRPGEHNVILAPSQGPELTASFNYPFRDGEDQCVVFALGDHLDVSDSCRVPSPPKKTTGDR